MKLNEYRTIFGVVGLVGVLLFSSPTLGLVVHLPAGEEFSELWLLGPGHMAEAYPFNVTADANYLVYVGVGNHLGSSAYYVAYVKFRNETEPLPDDLAGVPSDLTPLYTHRMFIAGSGSSEFPLDFSFSDVSSSNNRSTVGNIVLNGVQSSVNKFASWDANATGFYYQIFVELWIYETKPDAFVFNSRFVNLWLNMTSPS